MARKRQCQNTPPDQGPTLSGKPALVARGEGEIVTTADPASPNRTITRVQRVYHYEIAYSLGRITTGMHDAAARYLALHECLMGARPDHALPGIRSTTGWHPILSRVQASAILTTAHRALGNHDAAAVQLYVAENIPIITLADRWRVSRPVASKRVYGALERLAKHWGFHPP